jgi:hypothetical protein
MGVKIRKKIVARIACDISQPSGKTKYIHALYIGNLSGVTR